MLYIYREVRVVGGTEVMHHAGEGVAEVEEGERGRGGGREAHHNRNRLSVF
jgi:hypothetical protein